MNVAIVLSGGKGKRFGEDIPKQYMDLCGKKVIDYVIDAVLQSKTIDEIVLVIDSEYEGYVSKIKDKRIHTVKNGKERLNSVKNGLDYIKENFSNCDKVIITQAVSPLITSEIIDDYINNLIYYDVVTTAEKCPGEIFKIDDYKKRDREKYYFCQSPEAFKFDELYKYIDVESKYSELIYHYEKEPKIMFYTEFHNNIKLTFKSDLQYCEFLISNKKK